jgi:8-oxo-dGTP pyrophosphatase MutT (NUDIX family)
VREFEEETGFSGKNIHIIENLMPFEEIFMGSNYKSYKHKYYLAEMREYEEELPRFEKDEVSKMGWFTLDECLQRIRTYNVEKRRLLQNIDAVLQKYTRISV